MQNSNYFVAAGGRRWVLTIFEHLTPRELEFFWPCRTIWRCATCPVRVRWQPPTGTSGVSLPASRRRCSIVCPARASRRRPRRIAGRWAKCWRACIWPAPIFRRPCPIPAATPGASPPGAPWRRCCPPTSAVNCSPNSISRRRRIIQACRAASSMPTCFATMSCGRPTDSFPACSTSILPAPTTCCSTWRWSPTTGPPMPKTSRRCSPATVHCAALTPAEVAAWPAMRRAAALRFWLLRLEVRHHPRAGSVVTIKDPDHFGQLLQRLCLAPEGLPR